MKLRRGMALMLAVLCLLLCACGAGGQTSQDSVTVWCLEDDPLRPALEELIGQYNQDTGELLPVTLRAFPDEASLANAFDMARPDLLLCSHERAWALEQQGLLRDLRAGLGESAPAYPESLQVLSDGLGRSYFPLGAEVTLLCLHGEAAEPWADLEALCAYAAAYAAGKGEAFFTADSFGVLLYQELLLNQLEFHANLARDRENSDYCALYNVLADGVFDGGIALSDHSAAELLRGGALPGAAALSTALTALPGEGFVFSPLPGLQAGDPLPAMAWGLAVTVREGRSTRSAAGFLRWLLSEGRADQAALDVGMIPAAADAEPVADSALEEELLRLGAEHPFHLYEPQGDFLRNWGSFEESFRAALRRFL